MHAVFILYGIKNFVDIRLNELNFTKLPIRLHKEGEKDKQIPIQCQIRTLPFGVIEFVFPKEHANIVLTGLGFKKIVGEKFNKSFMGFKPIEMFKKFLNLEDIPDFKEEGGFPLFDLPITLIPLGVRYDKDIVEKLEGDLKGWTHEGI